MKLSLQCSSTDYTSCKSEGKRATTELSGKNAEEKGLINSA